MQRFWPLALSVALGAAMAAPALAQPFQVAEAIHPYTQQLYGQWLQQLDQAETASKAGADPEAALPVLEASDAWFLEKKQTLERHPAYKTQLVRQLKLRLKLARITAVMGLVAAEVGVKQKDAAYFTGKDGAYARLDKADAYAEAIAYHTGKDQPIYTDLVAYIGQVRGKVKEKAAQIQVAGVNTVLPPGTKLHSFTVMTFDTWLKNIAEDTAIAGGPKPLDAKVRELENGYGWFTSNRQELQKHPSFDQGMAKMAGVILALGELKTQKAVAFAQQGLKDMNPNMFSESSGTFQQLREAERLLAEGRVKGESAAEVKGLERAIAEAGVAVERLAAQYNQKAAAAFRLPADQYGGGDKGRLQGLVLAKWKSLYPQDAVLGVRFPKAAWERRKEASWNNGSWYFYDNSSLLVYVVIKKSGELATVYPAYVNKDNGTGALTIGAETKGAGYSHQDMLLKNLK